MDLYKHRDALLIVHLLFQLFNIKTYSHRIFKADCQLITFCSRFSCRCLCFWSIAILISIRGFYTYCTPIAAVIRSSPGVWVVLLFPSLQSCLPIWSQSELPVPRRQGVKQGRAELQWQVRVLPPPQTCAWARLVGRTALMQQSEDGSNLLLLLGRLQFLDSLFAVMSWLQHLIKVRCAGFRGIYS